jgi:hypothetical protein
LAVSKQIGGWPFESQFQRLDLKNQALCTTNARPCTDGTAVVYVQALASIPMPTANRTGSSLSLIPARLARLLLCTHRIFTPNHSGVKPGMVAPPNRAVGFLTTAATLFFDGRPGTVTATAGTPDRANIRALRIGLKRTARIAAMSSMTDLIFANDSGGARS